MHSSMGETKQLCFTPPTAAVSSRKNCRLLRFEFGHTLRLFGFVAIGRGRGLRRRLAVVARPFENDFDNLDPPMNLQYIKEKDSNHDGML